MRTLALLLVLTPVLPAQNEAALQRFFEGKRVRVKMDLPATKDGVDYYFRKPQPVDFKAYSDRIRRFGVALRNGDETMITTVKLKGKNIEFQLGGGGYGVMGDDSGVVTARSVPKSDREKQLEKDIAKETDRDRKDRMQRDLNRMRDQRQRDERYEQDEARRLSDIKKREIADKRLTAGSRFNVWFPDGYLKETSPTPRDVMDMLSEWIDFGGLQ